jgi:hypothetical protein
MTPVPAVLKAARAALYEVVNPARRESLLVSSTGDLTALRLSLRFRRPDAIAHWSADEPLEFETLATGLNPLRAERLLSLFAGLPQPGGWRLIPWRR